MKFGLAFVTHVYNEERANVVARTLPSLARTNTEGLERPVLRVTYRPNGFCYDQYFEALKEKFDVDVHTDPPDMNQFFVIIQDAGLKLLAEHPDVTHLGFMCDDSLCNPEWLQELVKLIGRHPDGIAWAVYRSAYSVYHCIVGGDETDVLMNMHDGIGCVTREEWQYFCRNGYVGCPDMTHAGHRPGNRWATKRDYIQNLGRHPGIEDVDCAIDFVGE